MSELKPVRPISSNLDPWLVMLKDSLLEDNAAEWLPASETGGAADGASFSLPTGMDVAQRDVLLSVVLEAAETARRRHLDQGHLSAVSKVEGSSRCFRRL
eukprot:2628875-Amphidinium_carterae.1